MTTAIRSNKNEKKKISEITEKKYLLFNFLENSKGFHHFPDMS